MRTLLTFLFLSLTAGLWGQTTQRFANIQLTATPTEAVAASVTNFLQLDGTGIGEKVSPTTLWSAVVLTGAVDTTDITGISSFAQTYLDDTTAGATLTTLGGTTIGQSMFTLTNPGAISFPRFNANNTITARTPLQTRSDLTLLDFYPEDYGTVADGSNDKAEIQAAVDAAALVGGRVVISDTKTYTVEPTSTGTGVLLKTGMRMTGKGRILFKMSTATTAFTGVSPFEHNTTSTAFGANEMDIEDVTLETDDPTNVHCHSLLGINHCPKARVRRVKLKNAYYHGVEIGKSKNVQISECEFTGDFASSHLQIDAGTSGIISTSGAAGANLTSDGCWIDRCYFANRTTTTLDTPGRLNIELIHANTQVLRNVFITNNVIHCNVPDVAGMTGGVTRSSVGVDSGALGYAEISNLVIEGNTFICDNGTSNMRTIYIGHNTGVVRKVSICNNFFDGAFRNLVYTGSASETAGAATSTNNNLMTGIKVEGNSAILRLGAPVAAGAGTRVMRLINVGNAADAVIRQNTFTLADTVEASWTSSGATPGSDNYFIFANHVRHLTCDQNFFNLLLDETIDFSFDGIRTASSGFEASGISAWQAVRGNMVNSHTATGTPVGIAYRYLSGVARSAWPNPPLVRGDWQNNTSTNVAVGSTFHNQQTAANGLPDWRPDYQRIGEKGKFASAPGGGWRELAGTAFASLTQEEQDAWQYQLAQGAVALPTEAGIYIRLRGSESGWVAFETSPP